MKFLLLLASFSYALPTTKTPRDPLNPSEERPSNRQRVYPDAEKVVETPAIKEGLKEEESPMLNVGRGTFMERKGGGDGGRCRCYGR